MASLSITHQKTLAVIDDQRIEGIEHAFVHPSRRSLVSVTHNSLQELDLATGALVGEIAFDLLTVGQPGSSAHVLELLMPVGSYHVVGVYQSRCIIVWDMQEMVLQSISEVEKLQKGIAAMAASLCKDRWIFYALEGSNSIKVTCVDSREMAKKISRKGANRSSQITCLAYSTARRLLTFGSSDGSFQIWSFSEENTLSGKEETAIAALMFSYQSEQSPVTQINFGRCGSASYLCVGFQNRTVELWEIFETSKKSRDPQRIATTQLSPPQVSEVLKKVADLTFIFHPQQPVLFALWGGHAGAGSYISGWQFLSNNRAGSMSKWYDVKKLTEQTADDGAGTEGSSFVATIGWCYPSLAVYVSSYTRSLALLRIEQRQEEISELATCDFLGNASLSTRVQLSFDNYHEYQDISTTLFQVTMNPESQRPSSSSFSSSSDFILQQFSLLTGTTDKLDDLPVWRNYQNQPLIPWKVLASHSQLAICIKLKDATPFLSTKGSDTDKILSYVVLELKEKLASKSQNSARAPDEDGDSESSGASTTRWRVNCGSLLDALDVCFSYPPSASDGAPSRPWLLIVLASTGKSISMQVQCDQVEPSRILLQREVLRVFPTPIPLSSQSVYVSTVGYHLLYLTNTANSVQQMLELSEDDLTVPATASTYSSWKTKSNEIVMDVLWNTSSFATPIVDSSATLLVAVWTTNRLVILTKNLALVREYDLINNLHEPQSMLWMAQTLLFVTRDNQLRYATPLHQSTATTSSLCTRLLCCLNDVSTMPEIEGVSHQVQLLSLCGDRLAYSMTNPNTLECKVFLRPISICEPLLMGFSTPVDALRNIFEREVLTFALANGNEALCPLTNDLLQLVYNDFGWKDTTVRLLDLLLHPTTASSASTSGGSSSGGTGSSSSSSYGRASHLSPSLMGSLFLHNHKWREFLRVFLAADPALEEYAFADDDSGTAASAKLPSKSGTIAHRFRTLAPILENIGQIELAVKCLDLAGDDVSLVMMTRKLGSSTAIPILSALQKDWTKMNPPLASTINALTNINMASNDVNVDSVVWRRHDLFSLLCCEALSQPERRSRLLTSVKPFDQMVLKTEKENQERRETPSSSTRRASILFWKRLIAEEVKDWVGVSSTPHFSEDFPKPPNYGFASSLSGSAGGGVGSSGAGKSDGEENYTATLSGNNAANSDGGGAKMTIGPFLEDEDAVIAYWRFEEGASVGAAATAGDGESNVANGMLECIDTSKRENHLQVSGMGSAMKLVTSTAPVDKGEENRIPEAFALQFPSSSDESIISGEWGAKCIVRPGATLDLGITFDDDPYRRKFTFEAWIRNYTLANKSQQTQHAEEHDGDFDTFASSTLNPVIDEDTRELVCRKSSDPDKTFWAFSISHGYLTLEFADQVVKSDDQVVTNAASWHHVAFSIDVATPKHTTVKLFYQGRGVGTKELDSSSLKTGGTITYLHFGPRLKDYEMTEVRLWATARTQEQLSDMKENYLGIAEAKKRMKIAIHQRNCQCEKCVGRRTKGPAAGGIAKLTLATPFPTTPPSGNVRDRRRPQPKQ